MHTLITHTRTLNRYEEDETIEMGHLGLLVDHDDVVKTIREYMDEKNEMMETTADALLTATKATAASNENENGEKNAASQNTRKRRDDAFWESASNVIPPRGVRCDFVFEGITPLVYVFIIKFLSLSLSLSLS